jgi:hypothetical protein
MKKTLLVAVFVGLAIFAFATAGVVYAQTDTPTVPDEGTPRFQMFGRGSFGMRLHAMADRGSGLLHDYMHPALAEAFGLTPAELQARIDAGDTLWAIAEEQGLTQDEFWSLKIAAHSQAVKNALADGVITQEQADFMLERIERMGQGGMGAGSCDGTRQGGGMNFQSKRGSGMGMRGQARTATP